jgi:hypothetical protein
MPKYYPAPEERNVVFLNINSRQKHSAPLELDHLRDRVAINISLLRSEANEETLDNHPDITAYKAILRVKPLLRKADCVKQVRLEL